MIIQKHQFCTLRITSFINESSRLQILLPITVIICSTLSFSLKYQLTINGLSITIKPSNLLYTDELLDLLLVSKSPLGLWLPFLTPSKKGF